MDNAVKLDSLEIMVQIIAQMYDSVRMVDPSNKKIALFSHEVSTRALLENKAIVKIEYDQGRVIMINAFPVKIEGQEIIVEMLKDITESGIIDIKAVINDTGKIESVINRRNIAIIEDDLTRVYNKRYIYERLPFEIAQSHGNRTPLTVIMADIDDFKRVNDTYGHIGGDYVLQGFAKLLKNYIRKDIDWVARFGGDEFLIVLGETDSVHGHLIAERTRKKVASTTITYEGQQIHLTGSFGVYTLFNEEITSEKLIERADNLLYESKENGKNKVSFREA